MPGLFSPNWFEKVVNEVDSTRIYNTDSNYPYNIILFKNDDDTPKQYIIEMALAGIPRESISVQVRDSVLIININVDKSTWETVDERKQYLRQGISQKKSTIKFTLSNDINSKNITSTYIDGLLRVYVPCSQPETHNIDITVD